MGRRRREVLSAHQAAKVRAEAVNGGRDGRLTSVRTVALPPLRRLEFQLLRCPVQKENNTGQYPDDDSLDVSSSSSCATSGIID